MCIFEVDKNFELYRAKSAIPIPLVNDVTVLLENNELVFRTIPVSIFNSFLCTFTLLNYGRNYTGWEIPAFLSFLSSLRSRLSVTLAVHVQLQQVRN